MNFVTSYVTDSKKRIDEYINVNNYLKAEQECKLSVSLLDGITGDVNWFKEKDASLKNNPAYKKQRQANRPCLQQNKI